LLANYDNKGMLALAGSHLKNQGRVAFENWIVRVLSSEKRPEVAAAIRAHLPNIVAT